jgi:hypothetical protein
LIELMFYAWVLMPVLIPVVALWGYRRGYKQGMSDQSQKIVESLTACSSATVARIGVCLWCGEHFAYTETTHCKDGRRHQSAAFRP